MMRLFCFLGWHAFGPASTRRIGTACSERRPVMVYGRSCSRCRKQDFISSWLGDVLL